jgi:hypothetical protein
MRVVVSVLQGRGFRPGRPAALAAAVCLGLAAVSLALPSAPTTDPWGWIVWGRQVTRLDLVTQVGGAPSWKPLPVILTTPLSLFGGAAPTLWLGLARAAGLLSLLFAYRLGDLLAGRIAGLLSAAGVALSGGWLRGLAHGYTEPIALALLFAAVERHLVGRPRQALVLGALVALARPEALPLVGFYGLVLWRRSEVRPGGLLLLLVSVPALWLVPDWLGSGNAFHGGDVARTVARGDPLEALAAAAVLTPPSFSLAAVAGSALAARRGGGPIPALTGGTLGWAGFLTLLMLAGYPASPRYFVLPAGLLCVLGGAGTVLIARAARPRPAYLALVCAAALVTLPALVGRGADAGSEARATVFRASLEHDLQTAIERAGPARLRGCGTPILPRGLAWVKGLVAWDLDLPLGRVRGMGSSARGFVATLASPRGGSATGSTPRTVTMLAAPSASPSPRPFVLLAPFGNAHLAMVGRPGLRLATVAAAGRWRVALALPRGSARPRLCRGAGRGGAAASHRPARGSHSDR